MSVDVEPRQEPRPTGGERGAQGSARRRLVWRVGVGLLFALILWGIYGGRLGGPSAPREVHGQLQQLTYPSVFGRAIVDRVALGYERVQVAGFGEEKARGPAAAIQGLLHMTRAGGLLFEVRGFASEGERDALLQRGPYACDGQTDTELLETVAGVEIRAVQRGWLFRWLPSSVLLCGTQVQGNVLTHVSGFVTDAAWHREAEALRRMLQGWQVDRTAVPHEADGCRMHVDHEPPLYVKFRSEALASEGVLSAESMEWIDLPYRDEGKVGRFTPALLDEVVGDCAEEQARFALVVEGGADPKSPEAQDAQHAFRVRCSPLFPMLRFLGAEELRPEVLPRPSQGWQQALDNHYVPAICLPASG